MGYFFATIGSAQVTSIFALLALLLSLLAFFSYIRDTIACRTQPQRASWLIWSVLSSIAFFTQVAEGATTSLWFIGAQFARTFSILKLSIWYGSGSYLSRRNLTIFAAAAVGLLLWYLLENTAYALAIVIMISAMGGYATVAKAYRAPESETLSTWFMLMAASICGVASVGVLHWMHMAYPVYLFGLYSSISTALILGRSSERGAVVPDADDLGLPTFGAADPEPSKKMDGPQISSNF